jgi:hypothetical protein
MEGSGVIGNHLRQSQAILQLSVKFDRYMFDKVIPERKQQKQIRQKT